MAALRRKDLALLVYLCVEGVPVHARGRLAALLWGESPEERARHSLTQAVGRLMRLLPDGVLGSDKEAVRWTGMLSCDAARLLREGMEPDAVDDAFSLYPGHFLEGFDPGAGAQDFREWADRRRAELRNAALRLLDRAGEQAEAAGAWGRALRLGRRAVEIDPVWEQGHRRVMRALAARGERNGALRHYHELVAYLENEVGGRPDPDTRALAEQLRAPPSAPLPSPPNGGEGRAGPDAPPPPEPASPRVGEDAGPSAAADPPAPCPGPPAGTAHPPAPESGERQAPARAREGAARRRPVPPWPWIALAAGLVALLAVTVRDHPVGPVAAGEPPPAHGESVRVRGSRAIFLAFADTLYQYPDSSTLCVCTGWYPDVVREVHRLPQWPRRMLPSVQKHAWLGGTLPIVSDHPSDKTAYVPVGCILPGVPDPSTLDSIFGSDARHRMLEVPDSVLARLPRAFIARGHPLRPAGTLIRGPDGRIRWITYHGGALEVADPALLATYCRSANQAVPVSAREFHYYRPWGRLAPGPEKCPPSG